MSHIHPHNQIYDISYLGPSISNRLYANNLSFYLLCFHYNGHKRTAAGVVSSITCLTTHFFNKAKGLLFQTHLLLSSIFIILPSSSLSTIHQYSLSYKMVSLPTIYVTQSRHKALNDAAIKINNYYTTEAVTDQVHSHRRYAPDIAEQDA